MMDCPISCWKSLTLVLVVPLLSVLLAGCGGCPWTEVSDVTVRPAKPCLELRVADASGRGDSTGCVDPVLVGKNSCSDTLLLPAEHAGERKEGIFGPGEKVVFEVAFEKAEEREPDRYEYSIPGRLGEESVTITFHTWLD